MNEGLIVTTMLSLALFWAEPTFWLYSISMVTAFDTSSFKIPFGDKFLF